MRKLALSTLLLSLSVQAADPTRYEDIVRAFEALSEPKGAMVVAGSSTIKIWGSIKTDLAPLTIVHRGIGGSQVGDWAYYLDRLILVHEPSAVALYVGDNDIPTSATPTAISNGIRDIARRIKNSYPNARVYLLGIKPSIARWSQWPKSVEANKLIKAMAASEGHRYIDTSAKLLGTDGKPIVNLYAADGLHLSTAGYKAWTAMVRPPLIEGESSPKLPKPPTDVKVTQ